MSVNHGVILSYSFLLDLIYPSVSITDVIQKVPIFVFVLYRVHGSHMYFRMCRKCCITENQAKSARMHVEDKMGGRNRKMNQFLLLKRGLLEVLQNNDEHIFDFILTLYLNLLDLTA